MLKSLNVIKSQYAPKDKSALWLKTEGGNASLYWFDGMQWVALTSGHTEGVETYKELIVGDTDEKRKANLSKLRPGTQLVKIGSRYGVAFYRPNAGGFASATIGDGIMVKYSISGLGGVTEIIEDENIDANA